MMLKVIDVQKLMERHAMWGSPSLFSISYQVLAIRKRHRKVQYLVEHNHRLIWWDQDLIEVVDGRIPEKWVNLKYHFFHKFKNRKYDFQISTSYYTGPSEFLENEDFFFDIHENPRIAYAFSKNIEDKYIDETMYGK